MKLYFKTLNTLLILYYKYIVLINFSYILLYVFIFNFTKIDI